MDDPDGRPFVRVVPMICLLKQGIARGKNTARQLGFQLERAMKSFCWKDLAPETLRPKLYTVSSGQTPALACYLRCSIFFGHAALPAVSPPATHF
jgi:hypothetical protein